MIFLIIFSVLSIFILYGLWVWCDCSYSSTPFHKANPLPALFLLVYSVIFLTGICLGLSRYENKEVETIVAYNIEGSSYIRIRDNLINLNKETGLNFEDEENLTIRISGPEWHGFIYLTTKYEVYKNNKVIYSKYWEQFAH